MSSDQIKGITFLVASSVEGLEPEHVTVVDSRGKVLSKNSDGSSVLSSDLFDTKRLMERDMEGRIESILSKVVGGEKLLQRSMDA